MAALFLKINTLKAYLRSTQYNNTTKNTDKQTWLAPVRLREGTPEPSRKKYT